MCTSKAPETKGSSGFSVQFWRGFLNLKFPHRNELARDDTADDDDFAFLKHMKMPNLHALLGGHHGGKGSHHMSFSSSHGGGSHQSFFHSSHVSHVVKMSSKSKLRYQKCKRNLPKIRVRCNVKVRLLHKKLLRLKAKVHRSKHILGVWVRKYRHCIKFCWWRHASRNHHRRRSRRGDYELIEQSQDGEEQSD